ncbi:MAG TPA: hypothetical protein VHO25_22260 [Polyangiaceae bacterium]|nr:hypothetical protein [Polyangiaceae bacterium]
MSNGPLWLALTNLSGHVQSTPRESLDVEAVGHLLNQIAGRVRHLERNTQQLLPLDADLHDAIESVGRVLKHGAEKHPGQWRRRTAEHHHTKSRGHLAKAEQVDAESGERNRAHHIGRELMILQLELEAS